jgi:L-alanine-DL-glutamate epimerase-like enolase superfamily enzyme
VSDLTIRSIEAFACSADLKEPVAMGLGLVVKREAVVVKVTTEGGLVGWGEAHHARSPRAMKTLINTTMRDLLVGMDASATTLVWQRVYANQLATHGMGSASVTALSGIDMALWDIRGKATGWPLYRLLGGQVRPIPVYAGGVALGFQSPESLVEEARGMIESGYRAVKLRIGRGVAADVASIALVRETFGPGLEIFVDANAQYTMAQAAQIVPELERYRVGWFEEPFTPYAYRSYRDLKQLTSVPLAAGENHFTRFEFQRLLDEGAVRVLQPDVSKTGGITEMMRIAAMASASHLPFCPHSSITGISMSATLHLMSALPNAEWFEAELARGNGLRDELCDAPYQVDGDGFVRAREGSGLAVEVDEGYLHGHPLTEGPAFVPAGLTG